MDLRRFIKNVQICIDQINKVLEVEAPISKNLFRKRVLSAWGISRNGARLNSYFETLFSEVNMHKTSYGNNVFFWKREQHPPEYDEYRSAENDYDKRDADDLPPEEVANAVKQVLQEQISLSKEDLIREAAKLFSFLKIGNNVENAMKQGIRLALANGAAKEENGRVVLKGK